MNPLLRSLARYTRPNFPFPNGLPISNIPRWNSFGGVGSGGMETRACSIVASSGLLNDPDGGFGNPASTGTLELGCRNAWDETKAILSRFGLLEFCTKYLLEDVITCLKLEIVFDGGWICVPLTLDVMSFHSQDQPRCP